MTLVQRVATFATMTLAAVGLVGTSTPGQAFETGSPITVTARLPQNVAPSDPVPLPSPGIDGDTALAEPTAPTAQFASLDDAVAAQAMPDTVPDELNCLAGAIYFEAKGEPLAGQLAVAKVIINRSRSKRFTAGICNVVTQPGQFSFVRAGRIPAIDAGRAAYRTAVAVAKIALNDVWDSPAPNALFFHARSVGVGHGGIRIAAIGNHIFYR